MGGDVSNVLRNENVAKKIAYEDMLEDFVEACLTDVSISICIYRQLHFLYANRLIVFFFANFFIII